MNYLIGGQTFGDRYGIDPAGLTLWLDQSDARSYGDLANWYDLSGLNNHVTQAVGADQPAILGSGALAGSSRLLDGNNEYMISGVDASLDFNGDMTVVTWMKIIAFVEVKDYIISTDWAGADAFYALRISAPDEIDFNIYNGTATVTSVAAGKVVDTWYHVVATYDSADIVLYVDGVVADTDPQTGANVLVDDRVWLGRREAGNFANAVLASVCLFSRALTAAEVQQLYLVDKPRHGGL